MFALFFSLYYSMFTGTWANTNTSTIMQIMTKILNAFGIWTSSLFNNVDTPMSTLGDTIFGISPYTSITYQNIYVLVAFILALITCIGIVVMAVKGIKRVFSIFFMPIR